MTGIKVGVLKSPWAVVTLPILPMPSRFSIWKM
jgi:hypothetical protein